MDLEYYTNELAKVQSKLRTCSDDELLILKDREQQLIGMISQIALDIGVVNHGYLDQARSRIVEV